MSLPLLSSLMARVLPPAGPQPVRVLMVCMGNICRSPTAEGVLRHKLQAWGLDQLVEVDSAGTHANHVGHAPDARAMKHALQRGYDLGRLRARKVSPQDFTRFDLLLAMDWDNLALLEEACPPEPAMRRRLRRLTEFLPLDSPLAGAQTVPDPYYGGPQGFEHVLDLVEAACDGLLLHLQHLVDSKANPKADGGTSGAGEG
jgi:protein-tyrosine phosphatase